MCAYRYTIGNLPMSTAFVVVRPSEALCFFFAWSVSVKKKVHTGHNSVRILLHQGSQLNTVAGLLLQHFFQGKPSVILTILEDLT